MGRSKIEPALESHSCGNLKKAALGDVGAAGAVKGFGPALLFQAPNLDLQNPEQQECRRKALGHLESLGAELVRDRFGLGFAVCPPPIAAGFEFKQFVRNRIHLNKS